MVMSVEFENVAVVFVGVAEIAAAVSAATRFVVTLATTTSCASTAAVAELRVDWAVLTAVDASATIVVCCETASVRSARTVVAAVSCWVAPLRVSCASVAVDWESVAVSCRVCAFVTAVWRLVTTVEAAEVESCAAATASVILDEGVESEFNCDDTSCKVVDVCCSSDAAVATAVAAASIVTCVVTDSEAGWITSEDAFASCGTAFGSGSVPGSLCSPPML